MTTADKWGRLGAALICVLGLVAVAAGQNTAPAAILGNFDINGLGGADGSPDTDGDGLPDSWEVGGLDTPESAVAFPAPDAIVPGTPPQPIFNRRPVRTSATSRDTDGDGLTDFVEVFGLMFIDENRNGVLDNAATFDGDGNVITDGNGVAVRATDADGNPTGEWFDFNQDGMPSIGEFPARSILIPGASENYDFDGFVFTDPTNPDTDGDGLLDGADNDPLINPSSFGDTRGLPFFPCGDLLNDRDCDNDGLGNGMDLGSDVDQAIDNPSDLERVLRVFRQDLVQGVSDVRVPEALIEDLLGADWNGDGLFRLTDILEPEFGLAGETPSILVGAIDLFVIEGEDADDLQFLGFAVTPFPSGSYDRERYYRFAARESGDPPLAFQKVLVPAGRDENIFLPDPRIWTVLYSWRFPGFDVDGNGFIGFDGASFSGDVTVNGAAVSGSDLAAENAPSSEHRLSNATGVTGVLGAPSLDGVVEVSGAGLCPLLGFVALGVSGCGVLVSGRRR